MTGLFLFTYYLNVTYKLQENIMQNNTRFLHPVLDPTY